MEPVLNRRRHRRVPASLRIFTRGDPRIFYSVQDISLGGVALQTTEALPAGTASTFGLQLPHHEAPLEVKGHVVWSSTVAMGVAFEDDGVAPMLSAFVERLERDWTRR